MDDKRNSLLTIGLVCAVLLVLGVADLWNSDRVTSTEILMSSDVA